MYFFFRLLFERSNYEFWWNFFSGFLSWNLLCIGIRCFDDGIFSWVFGYDYKNFSRLEVWAWAFNEYFEFRLQEVCILRSFEKNVTNDFKKVRPFTFGVSFEFAWWWSYSDAFIFHRFRQIRFTRLSFKFFSRSQIFTLQTCSVLIG